VILACLVCQMGLGLGGYIFAVFLKPIVHELGWSRTAFSGYGGPFLLAMALMSPIVGAATERFGARMVFSTAISVVALALIGLSYVTELWHFYVLGLVLGAATTGLGDIPVGAVVARAVRDARGLALGVVYIGSNIGGTIVPIVASMITDASSWRVALRVLAVGGWLVIFPFARWGVPAGRGEDAVEEAVETDGATLAEATRTASFWLLAGVLFLFYAYYLGVNHHLVAFLSDEGWTNAEAARRFGWAVAGGIAGKLVVGRFADVLPVRRVTIATFATVTLASFVLRARARHVAAGGLPHVARIRRRGRERRPAAQRGGVLRTGAPGPDLWGAHDGAAAGRCAGTDVRGLDVRHGARLLDGFRGLRGDERAGAFAARTSATTHRPDGRLIAGAHLASYTRKSVAVGGRPCNDARRFSKCPRGRPSRSASNRSTRSSSDSPATPATACR
jgi:MFS family permease